MKQRAKSSIGFFIGAFIVQTLLSLVGLAPSGDAQVLFLVAAAISLIMTASAFIGQYVGDRTAAPPSIFWATILGAICPIIVFATTNSLGKLGATQYIIAASFVFPGFALGWLGSKFVSGDDTLHGK